MTVVFLVLPGASSSCVVERIQCGTWARARLGEVVGQGFEVEGLWLGIHLRCSRMVGYVAIGV